MRLCRAVVARARAGCFLGLVLQTLSDRHDETGRSRGSVRSCRREYGPACPRQRRGGRLGSSTLARMALVFCATIGPAGGPSLVSARGPARDAPGYRSHCRVGLVKQSCRTG